MLTDIQLARLMLNARFPDAVLAVAIVLAESGGDPQARNTSVPGNIDRGLWQFSSKWHGDDVPDEVAYDPVRSTQAAFEHSKRGTDFSLWNTYKSGKYVDYLARAREAVAGVVLFPPEETDDAVTRAEFEELQSEIRGLRNVLAQALALAGEAAAAKVISG